MVADRSGYENRITHVCGTYSAVQEETDGLILYAGAMSLYVNGNAWSIPFPVNQLEENWFYEYTMVGATRTTEEFQGHIYDARYYPFPMDMENINKVYDEGYQWNPLTDAIWKGPNVTIHFFCTIDPCWGSDIVLAKDCHDLEDPTKRSEYGKVADQRHGTLDASSLNVGEYYELCWKQRKPTELQSMITPYIARFGRTGTQIFVKVPVEHFWVHEMKVTSAILKLQTKAIVATYCKVLLRGGYESDIFVMQPFQIRKYGVEATWTGPDTNGTYIGTIDL